MNCKSLITVPNFSFTALNCANGLTAVYPSVKYIHGIYILENGIGRISKIVEYFYDQDFKLKD